ncbi:Rieske (2Fe-2S) protein [Brevibacterium sp. 50QC2O2]|uniref:Rieske (2Fe-2S) protein n=1 Tax=unclassified Brevibacterium TaxID=2614124 RepID=UPI00211D001A|nr:MULTISPECIES: Rieske (2Fe-2S) protein [unclassified Brevibacterium]MCQ9368539.1 Rieske (2Fe-2S) protein [Brevibacterium sp. 91QC2O2]MCQ9388603.1 Rieske (2Fe-2S) protein [Brevibacterium sp. 50QC2O2]
MSSVLRVSGTHDHSVAEEGETAAGAAAANAGASSLAASNAAGSGASAPSRRRILKSAAVGVTGVAVVGGLAACGSESKAPEPLELPETEVPVGSGVVKNSWVVVQPTKGDFKAYSAICPHQGCLVRQVTKDDITCPCHTSVFSTEDGSKIAGPANKGLTPGKVEKSGAALKISAS